MPAIEGPPRNRGGRLRGDILAERVEIRASGRVWGNVVTASMSTEDGAFLRGQIQMEEKVELGLPAPAPVAEAASEEQAEAKAVGAEEQAATTSKKK